MQKLLQGIGSTDSYPQSGDRAQEVLNKQFVRECDAAVALFWTKFGTPTETVWIRNRRRDRGNAISRKKVFSIF